MSFIGKVKPLLLTGIATSFSAAALFATEIGTTNELLDRLVAAYRAGKLPEAISFATEAIKKEPGNAVCYFMRGAAFSANHEPAKAVKDFDSALKLDSNLTNAWQSRGLENFKLGNIKDSISDFDHFLSLRPAFAPQHWQRGIAYYYDGQYQKGRKQFELHQTVNPNDVENAVWHFLCVARIEGREKARSLLISITGDTRVPMMEIHRLFAGTGTAEDVIEAAKKGNPSPPELKQRQFYGHLYLGLYYESLGEQIKSQEHIRKAAVQYRGDDYMGDVAQVHFQLRDSSSSSNKPGAH